MCIGLGSSTQIDGSTLNGFILDLLRNKIREGLFKLLAVYKSYTVSICTIMHTQRLQWGQDDLDSSK